MLAREPAVVVRDSHVLMETESCRFGYNVVCESAQGERYAESQTGIDFRKYP